MGQDRRRRRSRLLAGVAVASLAVAAITPGVVVGQSPSAAAPSATFPTLPPPEKTSINIGMSVAETSQFAVKLAEMLGIFQKYGITPTISVFEGDGKVIQALQDRQGLKVACLEEIAYRMGHISRDQLLRVAHEMKNNEYGRYLARVADEDGAA